MKTRSETVRVVSKMNSSIGLGRPIATCSWFTGEVGLDEHHRPAAGRVRPRAARRPGRRGSGRGRCSSGRRRRCRGRRGRKPARPGSPRRRGAAARRSGRSLPGCRRATSAAWSLTCRESLRAAASSPKWVPGEETDSRAVRMPWASISRRCSSGLQAGQRGMPSRVRVSARRCGLDVVGGHEVGVHVDEFPGHVILVSRVSASGNIAFRGFPSPVSRILVPPARFSRSHGGRGGPPLGRSAPGSGAADAARKRAAAGGAGVGGAVTEGRIYSFSRVLA